MEAKWKIGRLVVRKTHSALLLKLVKSLEAKTSIPNILGSIPNILGVVLYGGREDVNDYPRALLYCFFFFWEHYFTAMMLYLFIYTRIYIFFTICTYTLLLLFRSQKILLIAVVENLTLSLYHLFLLKLFIFSKVV